MKTVGFICNLRKLQKQNRGSIDPLHGLTLRVFETVRWWARRGPLHLGPSLPGLPLGPLPDVGTWSLIRWSLWSHQGCRPTAPFLHQPTLPSFLIFGILDTSHGSWSSLADHGSPTRSMVGISDQVCHGGPQSLSTSTYQPRPESGNPWFLVCYKLLGDPFTSENCTHFWESIPDVLQSVAWVLCHHSHDLGCRHPYSGSATFNWSCNLKVSLSKRLKQCWNNLCNADLQDNYMPI